MTRGFLRLVLSSPPDFEKNHNAQMRTANDLPVKQFVRVEVGSAGLSRLSDSLSRSSPLRFFLRLPFCVCFPSSSSRTLPPRWSLRGSCSQGRLLESSSLASRLLSSRSRLLPAPPPHLQLSLFLVALSSPPSSLPPCLLSHLNPPLSFGAAVSSSSSLTLFLSPPPLSLSFANVSSLGFCERT